VGFRYVQVLVIFLKNLFHRDIEHYIGVDFLLHTWLAGHGRRPPLTFGAARVVSGGLASRILSWDPLRVVVIIFLVVAQILVQREFVWRESLDVVCLCLTAECGG